MDHAMYGRSISLLKDVSVTHLSFSELVNTIKSSSLCLSSMKVIVCLFLSLPQGKYYHLREES